MISLQQCTAVAGLSSQEVILGVTPSARHETLLRSYLSISYLSPAAICDLIVTDLRKFLDLGARRQAADRFIVLRCFLSDHPDPRPSRLLRGRSNATRERGLRGCQRGARTKTRLRSPASAA